jgi:hypothetical protein
MPNAPEKFLTPQALFNAQFAEPFLAKRAAQIAEVNRENERIALAIVAASQAGELLPSAPENLFSK